MLSSWFPNSQCCLFVVPSLYSPFHLRPLPRSSFCPSTSAMPFPPFSPVIVYFFSSTSPFSPSLLSIPYWIPLHSNVPVCLRVFHRKASDPHLFTFQRSQNEGFASIIITDLPILLQALGLLSSVVMRGEKWTLGPRRVSPTVRVQMAGRGETLVRGSDCGQGVRHGSCRRVIGTAKTVRRGFLIGSASVLVL